LAARHRFIGSAERLAGRAAYAAPLNASTIRSVAAIALCGRAVAYGSAVNDECGKRRVR
jgi:hypothetical protein